MKRKDFEAIEAAEAEEAERRYIAESSEYNGRRYPKYGVVEASSEGVDAAGADT